MSHTPEEKWMEVYANQTAAIERLEQQRDELLAVLKEISEAQNKTPTYLQWLAREAITKVQGDKT
jgi:hypothetical protein